MLDTNTFIPLYYQLKLHIEEQIHAGNWKPGNKLPSEAELGEEFKILRTTVRQALGELVNQGQLTRVQGKGTFVAHPRIRQYLTRLTGFTEDIQTRKMKPGSQLLRYSVEPANETVASALKLSEGSLVIVLERLRLADQLPVAVEISRLRQDFFPAFDVNELTGGSLYTYLTQKFNIIPTTAHQDMEAISCPHPQARQLDIAKGKPVLHIYRTTFEQAGRAFEQTESFYRGDRYVFQAELTSRRLKSPIRKQDEPLS